MGQPMAIPTKDFVLFFDQWKRRWENCVRSQGAYFEGDWGIIVLSTMFLVPSINVSIFHSKWLNIFWTDLTQTCTKSSLIGHYLKVKIWKQPRYPATNKWINKMWYIYIMECHLVFDIKRKIFWYKLQHGWTSKAW